jgi:tRNA nucleotidyltransferase (CCA-adding enzyme)
MISAYGFIVICDLYVLLVQSKKGNWGFPKGKIEKGELPFECAFRELREETGLKQNDIIPLDMHTLYLEEKSYTGKPSVRLYLAITEEKIIPKISDIDELKDVQWIKIDEADKYLKIKNRFNILQEAVKMLDKS